MLFMSAILESSIFLYPLKRGSLHVWSSSCAEHSASLPATRSSLAKMAATSVPKATLPAPVSVAQSMTRSGDSSQAATSASARTSLPSASVLPISDVRPLRAVSTSPGRKAPPEMEFSTAQTSTRRSTSRPSLMTMWARPRTCPPPPMSFFIFPMAAAGLMSSPPVSKHTPLPTSATFLPPPPAPHRISINRGACLGSAARPTACTWG
mmetsp:Transcript_5854/g.15009  ORF Transcript_5854/g.15009 Transcript_5854/m.15009 type:complete len:208 (+) Transcript_5854:464-1087(+)